MKDYFPPAGLKHYYFGVFVKLVLFLVLLGLVFLGVIFYPEIIGFLNWT